MRKGLIVCSMVALLAFAALAGCGAKPTPYPTYTPLPTYTWYPTYTPYPTCPPWPPWTATPVPTNPPEPAATNTPGAPTVGAKSNPVPLGEAATKVNGGRTYRGHIREVVSDQARVRQMLPDATVFDRLAAKGFEGFLIYFVCEYVSGPQDEPASVSSADFDFLGGDGLFYAEPIEIVEPEPSFGGSGLPGTTFEGWLYRTCKVSDKPDLLIWKENLMSILGTGVYFALQ